MNDAVVTEDIGRVRVIKMNRPDALNSMNPWMFMGIRDALHDAQDDDTVAVAVITGEGRAFCAGLDLADSNSPDPALNFFQRTLATKNRPDTRDVMMVKACLDHRHLAPMTAS